MPWNWSVATAVTVGLIRQQAVHMAPTCLPLILSRAPSVKGFDSFCQMDGL